MNFYQNCVNLKKTFLKKNQIFFTGVNLILKNSFDLTLW